MVFRLQSRTALVSLLAIFLVANQGSGGEIHDLLRKEEIEKAKALLVGDPKLKDARDDSKMTPLHIAVHLGQLEIAKLLLEQGADVNARADNDFVPLYFAKDPEMVRLLIAHKADLEAKSAGSTLLQQTSEDYRFWYASEPETAEAKKRRTIINTMLDAGAYYNIYAAISLDDLNRVKILLKGDPTLALDKGVMRHAARAGRATVVKLLLDHKADPKDSGDGGYPVLYFALEHPDVVRVLIQAGADAKVRLDYHPDVGHAGGLPQFGLQGSMLLHQAAEKGQVETVKLLIEAGAEVDCRSKHENATPLAYAALSLNPEMVKFLLKNKASIQGEDGHRAIVWASDYSYLWAQKQTADVFARYKAIIALLCEAGVPVDVLTAVMAGETDLVHKIIKKQPALATEQLLAIAVRFNHKETVTALLDAGAPIEGKDENGYTALHRAAFEGREEIAKLLIDRKADVNALTKYRATPLHEAARCGSHAVAKLLLAARADANAKDDEGKTPLARAKESDKEIIELLKKHGGK